MVTADFNRNNPARQGAGRTKRKPHESNHDRLGRILDSVDTGLLVDTLEAYHQTGRPGYHPKSMIRAYFAKMVLRVPFVKGLLSNLRTDDRLRDTIGFGTDVPSEAAMSRLVTRLKAHQDMVDDCIAQLIRAIAAEIAALSPVDDTGQPLPKVGEILAADSTLFEAFANPHSGADPDARHGYKNSARSKDGKPILRYGYKMQLICDAVHDFPLGFTINPGDKNDYQTFPGALEKTLETHPWMEPKYITCDAGYDSDAVHRLLDSKGIAPVIDIRKPGADDGLYHGIYSANWRPVCMGQVDMEYVETDPKTGEHLFRCRKGGCHKLGEGLVPNCVTELRVDPHEHPRVVGQVVRNTPFWDWLYSFRMSVERMFSSLKFSRGLEGAITIGMAKVKLFASLSILTYLSTMLEHLQRGEYDQRRQMAFYLG